MKDVLNLLFEGKKLSKDLAKQTLKNIASGVDCNPSQIASFITSFLMRSITTEELEGFREALLDLCIEIPLEAYDPIDLCGTGGDGKNAFNISTISSFVVAGAGVPVAKHGNYGVSSHCGSSNVLEFLGIKFTSDKSQLEKQIETAGICFLHAPLFHPALKNLAPIRKELGVKTFFNILGPMINPSRPNKQIVGVYSLELARLYAYIYQKTSKSYAIVHSLDGFDEISLTSRFKWIQRKGEAIYNPEDWGLKTTSLESLSGGQTIHDAAQILIEVLSNKGTFAQNQVVYANSGAALLCAGKVATIEEGIALAEHSIKSGAAKKSFDTLVQISI